MSHLQRDSKSSATHPRLATASHRYPRLALQIMGSWRHAPIGARSGIHARGGQFQDTKATHRSLYFRDMGAGNWWWECACGQKDYAPTFEELLELRDAHLNPKSGGTHYPHDPATCGICQDRARSQATRFFHPLEPGQWKPPAPISAPVHRLVIYEPRWHGWALWERSTRFPGFMVLEMVDERGWMRRPRGAPYLEFESCASVQGASQEAAPPVRTGGQESVQADAQALPLCRHGYYAARCPTCTDRSTS
jgi:hypothetical protein